jgi:hypothetical protein
MCRWLAYSGSPILLEELLYKPTHDCPRPASDEGRRRERPTYRYKCCRSQRMAIAPQIGGR